MSSWITNRFLGNVWILSGGIAIPEQVHYIGTKSWKSWTRLSLKEYNLKACRQEYRVWYVKKLAKKIIILFTLVPYLYGVFKSQKSSKSSCFSWHLASTVCSVRKSTHTLPFIQGDGCSHQDCPVNFPFPEKKRKSKPIIITIYCSPNQCSTFSKTKLPVLFSPCGHHILFFFFTFQKHLDLIIF